MDKNLRKSLNWEFILFALMLIPLIFVTVQGWVLVSCLLGVLQGTLLAFAFIKNEQWKEELEAEENER